MIKIKVKYICIGLFYRIIIKIIYIGSDIVTDFRKKAIRNVIIWFMVDIII